MPFETQLDIDSPAQCSRPVLDRLQFEHNNRRPIRQARGWRRKSRILRVAYNREIDVMNAYTSQNLVDIEFSMVEGLITTDEHNTYIPVLAKKIPTEANGLIVRQPDGTIEMTWHLQEDVRWHDGPTLDKQRCLFHLEVRLERRWPRPTTGRSIWEYWIAGPQTPTPSVFQWDGEYGFFAGIFRGNTTSSTFWEAWIPRESSTTSLTIGASDNRHVVPSNLPNGNRESTFAWFAMKTSGEDPTTRVWTKSSGLLFLTATLG